MGVDHSIAIDLSTKGRLPCMKARDWKCFSKQEAVTMISRHIIEAMTSRDIVVKKNQEIVIIIITIATMTTGYLRNMTSKVRYGHSSSSHESIFGCVYQPAIQLIIHLSGIPPSDLFLEATILTDIFSSHHPHRYLSQPPPTQSQYPEKFACASDWTFRKIITKKTSHTFFPAFLF